MNFWVLWIIPVILLLFLVIYLYRRSSSPSNRGVIEVRVTPRREVEGMTVDEYWELGVDYLEEQGYEWIEDENEPFLVKYEGKTFLVHYDPAGKAEHPREINEIIVKQRKQGVEGLVLITSAELRSQSDRLTQRAGMKVLDPDTLVNWRRRNPSGQGASPLSE